MRCFVLMFIGFFVVLPCTVQTKRDKKCDASPRSFEVQAVRHRVQCKPSLASLYTLYVIVHDGTELQHSVLHVENPKCDYTRPNAKFFISRNSCLFAHFGGSHDREHHNIATVWRGMCVTNKHSMIIAILIKTINDKMKQKDNSPTMKVIPIKHPFVKVH